MVFSNNKAKKFGQQFPESFDIFINGMIAIFGSGHERKKMNPEPRQASMESLSCDSNSDSSTANARLRIHRVNGKKMSFHRH